MVAAARPQGRREDAAAILRRCIEAEADALRTAYAVYLHSAWPMSKAEAWEQAGEVLAEVVTIALTKAADFDITRRPHPWLLGIGSRVILRYRAAQAKKSKWEAAARCAEEDDMLPPEALFNELSRLTARDPGASLEDAEAVTALLAPLSPSDQRVIRLAYIAELDGERLALALKCKPGTARVRLSRALERLRKVWRQSASNHGEGSPQ